MGSKQLSRSKSQKKNWRENGEKSTESSNIERTALCRCEFKYSTEEEKKTLAIVYVESNRKQIDKKKLQKVRCLDVASVYYMNIEHADHAVKEKE